MIATDLTKDVKTSLKTIIGQLNYVLGEVDNEQQAENLLLQLNAAQSTLKKTLFILLNDTYRKVLAQKISSAHQHCPGNCGQEENIEKLRQLFPELKLEEIPEKLAEAGAMEKKILNFLSEKNLDTPPPSHDL